MSDSHRNHRQPAGLIFCAFCTFAAMARAGDYGGGCGTEENPFQIWTAEHWKQLVNSNDPNDPREDYYILMGDLDLSGEDLSPVGSLDNPFIGIFEGNRHVIRNAVLGQFWENSGGLFGCLGPGAQIRNLGVEDMNISGGNYVGCLVGKNQGGTITACYAIGNIQGGYRSKYFGILCGSNSGTINECYAMGNVNGGEESECLGGLCGLNEQGMITSCYAIVSLTVGEYSISLGGLCGVNESGTIQNCFSTGMGFGTLPFLGVAGHSSGPILSSFWDTHSDKLNSNATGKGLTTEDMKTFAFFQNAGWGGKGWVMTDGKDYPRLAWENTGDPAIPDPERISLVGSGTENDPYQIWTAEEFASLSWYTDVLDKHLLLKKDLDVNDVVLYPIGDLGPFSGVFDGDGHHISGIDIQQPYGAYVGLFGYLGKGGQIRNISTEVNIMGIYDVGGLVGVNEGGTITSCSTMGEVRGFNRVGGLIGWNLEGKIVSCNTAGTINSGANWVVYSVGGLVGVNEEMGEIEYCHTTGNILTYMDSSETGGLVGVNFGTITSCYVTGRVLGGFSVGGLVGANGSQEERKGKIQFCYVTGDVLGTDYPVGGLVGWNYDSILSCAAAGEVEGDYGYVGGLVGLNGGSIDRCNTTGPVIGNSYSTGGLIGGNGGVVTGCSSAGMVKGLFDVGGLAGSNSGTIRASYATGAVQGDLGNGGLVGWNYQHGMILCCFASGAVSKGSGLVGYRWNDATTISSFWDIQTTGKSGSVGGIGKTTAEMKTLGTFTSAGWDFVGEGANGAEDMWRMCADGVSYPRLSWEFSRGGDMDCPDGVAMEDLLYLAGRWMASTPETAGAADADGSGKVDLSDFEILATNWMRL
jgi:hypothetical protein